MYRIHEKKAIRESVLIRHVSQFKPLPYLWIHLIIYSNCSLFRTVRFTNETEFFLNVKRKFDLRWFFIHNFAFRGGGCPITELAVLADFSLLFYFTFSGGCPITGTSCSEYGTFTVI